MKKEFFDLKIKGFAEQINKVSRNPHAVGLVNKNTYSLLGHVEDIIGGKKGTHITAINSLNIIRFDKFHPVHSDCYSLLKKIKNELKEQIGDTEDHFKILIEGKEVWNEWRKKNSGIVPLLQGKNFRDMDLITVNLSNAFLRKSIFSYANLTGADFTESDVNKANFDMANLPGANFSNADLSYASFLDSNLSHAKFNGASLRRADLIGARLIKVDLSDADLTGANIYGTSRDDWKIDGVKCDFVYFDDEGKTRIPKEGDFSPGEFEEKYKHLPKIEYYFAHGFTPIDAIIMDQVVQAINRHHPKFELKLDSFHSRGQPHAVFTVTHKDYADEALNEIKRDYENQIKVIEAQRDTLRECFLEAIEKPNTFIGKLEMGDKYYIKESQVGAVGYKSHAHNMNFPKLWEKASSQIDLNQLSEELFQLRQAIKGKAQTLEHDKAIGEIAAAEAAAKNGDGAEALEHLKNAGRWALNVAEKIGTSLATAAFKAALGL